MVTSRHEDWETISLGETSLEMEKSLDDELDDENSEENNEFESDENSENASTVTVTWYLYFLHYFCNFITCHLAMLPPSVPDQSSPLLNKEHKYYGTMTDGESQKQEIPPTYFAVNPSKLSTIFKESFLWSTAFVTTIPHALFSYSFPDSPKTFLARWPKMSPQMKTVCMTAGTVSLIDGTLFKRQYLQAIFSKTWQLFRDYFKSPYHFGRSTFILFSSLVAAIPAGALGFQGFQAFLQEEPETFFATDDFAWAKAINDSGMSYEDLAIGIAGFMLNLSIVFGFRVLFNSNFWDLYFDPEQRFKRNISHQLKQLKPDYIAKYNTALQGQPLDASTVREILETIYDDAYHIREASFFRSDSIFISKSLYHYLKDYVHPFAWGAWLGTTFYLFFAEEGLKGVELICDALFEKCELRTTLNSVTQHSLGVLVGHATGILGYMTGLEVPTIATALYEHLRENPSDWYKVALIGLLSIIDAAAFISAGRSITHRDNLFGFTPNNIGGILFVPSMGVLSFKLSTIGISKLLILNKKPFPAHSPTLNDVQKWIAQDPAALEISKKLRNHGFFGGKGQLIQPENDCRPFPKCLKVG